MTYEALRDAMSAKPFRPFKLRLADGDRLSVPHPEFCHVPPRISRTFAVWNARGGYTLVDLMVVSAIEFGRNGRQRKAG